MHDYASFEPDYAPPANTRLDRQIRGKDIVYSKALVIPNLPGQIEVQLTLRHLRSQFLTKKRLMARIPRDLCFCRDFMGRVLQADNHG